MLKIGVVIPTYNRRELLERAINSVLNQTYQNFVICVVDDCSPDDTESMLHKYNTNNKINYIRLENNSGVNVARNKAIDYLISKEINCDYITMLDDDDYFKPDVLKEATKQINSTSTSWLTFNKVYPNGEKITKCEKYGNLSYLEDKYCGTAISGDAVKFISKELIGKNRFEESFRAREYLFYLLLNKKSNMYVYDYDAAICEYLPDGMTHSQKRETKEEKRRIREIEQQILNTVGLSFELLEYKRTKDLFIKAIKERSIKKVLKYLRHIIKWLFLMFFKNIKAS